MNRLPAYRRLLVGLQALALVAIIACPPAANATGDTPGDTVLELRPHCDKTGDEELNVFGGPIPIIRGIMTPTDGMCYSFPVSDPQHRETPIYETGAELDMDLVIVNPKHTPISRVRGWIAYDPTMLEGESIEMSPSFAVPTPGEADFDIDNSVGKIGASSNGPLDGAIIKVARIKMKVMDTSVDSTVLSFDDVTGTVDSHSAVISKATGNEVNVLPSTLGSLIVRLKGPHAHGAASQGTTGSGAQMSKSSGQQSSNATGGTNGQSSAALTTLNTSSKQSSISSSLHSSVSSQMSQSTTAFTLLQVQNLRATTDGTSVFLSWDALPTAETRGYNIYYSTTSGKYIQRRTIDATATTLTIRGLVQGTTYYFAVRGINAKNQESQFSKEVGITVGSPETSTAPLTASALEGKGPAGKGPATGGTISGNTGTPSIALAFFALCAVTGTFLAFRRQLVASAVTHG